MHRIINTGIASFGMSGKIFHAPFLHHNPHFALRAIVQRHESDSRDLYPESKLYRSFDEMIRDNEIELIIVNTPVQTHFEYTKRALLAGKAVIVEKPFTVDSKEAEQLEALAKEQEAFLSVYQNRRFDGDFLEIKKVLESGVLGEIKEAEFRYDRFRPGLSGKAHKEGDIAGAGILHDIGAHLIDQAIQLFGFPHAVFADLENMRKGGLANDYCELIFFYSHSKQRVRLKASVFIKEIGYSFMLHGDQGSFMQMRSDIQDKEISKGATPSINKWIPTRKDTDGILNIIKNGNDIRKETKSDTGNYMDYYEAVYNALVHSIPNPVPASDGVQVMKIIDAAFRSVAEKKIIIL